MARLSISALVLCLVLALMATAQPVKREDPLALSGNDFDAKVAEDLAAQSLQSASEMIDQMTEKANKDDKNKTPTSSAAAAAPSSSTAHTTENKEQPEPSATTPTTSSEATPVESPKASSSHIVNDDPLSNIPLIGGLLSGGGLI
ncbi:hypothetical protein BO70DRAFT_378895 [Aspergillus heteromorphus CBS 117.55]|uniref:GPI anchored protein n=1 Tax=Aspergillus heteromorphus CBS 117.55 TaxID=1448321 RepID=A0A317WIU0_9EURO|nr:uncharacterized protein BO70DRAFT_378895 [Aspergillus heteromorphus CBS 117.55]PWY86283.1 hypothetical protein BO70DRAFT_378895 [Aspergillus heteromorphus CBS 117.55]